MGILYEAVIGGFDPKKYKTVDRQRQTSTEPRGDGEDPRGSKHMGANGSGEAPVRSGR